MFRAPELEQIFREIVFKFSDFPCQNLIQILSIRLLGVSWLRIEPLVARRRPGSSFGWLQNEAGFRLSPE
jgi:hypothetical protein